MKRAARITLLLCCCARLNKTRHFLRDVQFLPPEPHSNGNSGFFVCRSVTLQPLAQSLAV